MLTKLGSLVSLIGLFYYVCGLQNKTTPPLSFETLFSECGIGFVLFVLGCLCIMLDIYACNKYNKDYGQELTNMTNDIKKINRKGK